MATTTTCKFRRWGGRLTEGETDGDVVRGGWNVQKEKKRPGGLSQTYHESGIGTGEKSQVGPNYRAL